jgi:DNA-binding transcriptional regulator YiaG
MMWQDIGMPLNPAKLARVRAMTKSGDARRIRLTSGLSLEEIGAPCGVDQSTIYRWEIGLRAPQGEAAIRYLAVLDALAKVAVAA